MSVPGQPDLLTPAPPSRVVHVRDGFDVYIGGPSPARRGPFGNPFKLNRDGDRATVIERFRAWVREQPELLRRAHRELPGKRLGCFCAPLACHGDVLRELVETTASPPEPVFVFGSNLAGRHGMGAAKSAAMFFGARAGQGEGRMGQCYAIPTKSAALAPLPLAQVHAAAERFLAYVSEHTAERYQLTRCAASPAVQGGEG